MNGLRFYALSVNWSLLLLLSASCVIVGAKFALEKEFLPAWLRYLAMQRRYRWMNHLPANSPWTTVNQLLLGGRAPTDRLKLLLRSPSILESYSVFLPVVVIRVRCPHLKMRCKTMAGAAAAVGSSSKQSVHTSNVPIIWLLRAIAHNISSSKPRCIHQVG